MRIGGAKVSATDQSLKLQHDDLKPAFDAVVDPPEARKGTSSHVYRPRTTATPPHATGMRADVSVFPLL
jgi:hypothetical protein